MNEILKGNEAFKGMSVTTHFEYWVVPGVVVYDLRSVTGGQTPLDVYAAFLEYAREQQGQRYRRSSFATAANRASSSTATRSAASGRSTRSATTSGCSSSSRVSRNRFPVSGSPSEGEALVHFHKHCTSTTPRRRACRSAQRAPDTIGFQVSGFRFQVPGFRFQVRA